jgi:thymidylate synthase
VELNISGESQYLSMLRLIVAKGKLSANRTATKTIKLFSHELRMDLQLGFPLVTTKKMFMKGFIREDLWFLEGSTNNRLLRDNGVNIWNEWALEDGSLGPIYGEQWRHFPAGEYFNNMDQSEVMDYVDNMASDQKLLMDEAFDGGDYDVFDWHDLVDYLNKEGIDQINLTLRLLREDPNSRRIIVTSWNPQVVPSGKVSPQENVRRGRGALAACHTMFQFLTEELTLEERYAQYQTLWSMPHIAFEYHEKESLISQMDNRDIPKYRLNCKLLQRSADAFLGVPFNIAGYALLTHLFAHCVNMVPGEFVWSGVDVHLYTNHLEQVEEQLTREKYKAPTLWLNPDVRDLFQFTPKDIKILDYKCHPPLKGEVAV